MVIVKHGNLKEEDFTCERCGCEFIADMTEYKESYSNHERYYIIQCPRQSFQSVSSLFATA